MVIKPLDGVRVLDFTAFPPGAACTVMLADLGAQIIRVEPPSQKGKPSLVFGQVQISRAKSSMCLDMRNPAANDILKRLAPSIDIVVENAKPGSMEARGFGYKQARAANPKIIWCAITGFGQSGPYADYAGHDLSYVAHSGLLDSLSADPEWTPGTSLAIPAGAQAAVIGIQAALLQRARTNEGAFVDIALSEAAGWFLNCGINPLSDAPFRIGISPERRNYACADGRYVAIASSEPRTWEPLCELLGVPELKTELFKPASAALQTQTFSDIFKTQTAAHWIDLLAPAGVAIVAVNRGAELLADPQVRARGSVVDVSGTPSPANPVRLSNAAGDRSETATAAPPKVGQDTSDILLSAGFSPAEIDVFTQSGLI